MCQKKKSTKQILFILPTLFMRHSCENRVKYFTIRRAVQKYDPWLISIHKTLHKVQVRPVQHVHFNALLLKPNTF